MNLPIHRPLPRREWTLLPRLAEGGILLGIVAIVVAAFAMQPGSFTRLVERARTWRPDFSARAPRPPKPVASRPATPVPTTEAEGANVPAEMRVQRPGWVWGQLPNGRWVERREGGSGGGSVQGSGRDFD